MSDFAEAYYEYDEQISNFAKAKYEYDKQMSEINEIE